MTDEEYKDLTDELGSRISEYIGRLSSYMKANNRIYQDPKVSFYYLMFTKYNIKPLIDVGGF